MLPMAIPSNDLQPGPIPYFVIYITLRLE